MLFAEEFSTRAMIRMPIIVKIMANAINIRSDRNETDGTAADEDCDKSIPYLTTGAQLVKLSSVPIRMLAKAKYLLNA